MVKVSVIIPCYNHGRFINEAVESVLAQTMNDYEIIIVNDGSTDTYTNDLLSNYSQPNTTIYTNSNHGLAYTRNFAIKKAQGEYILPLDADDKIAPDCLRQMSEVLDKDDNVGAVGCQVEFFDAKTGLFDLPDFTLEVFLQSNCIVATSMYRKSDWEKCGGYNENLVKGLEDYDYWLSILSLGKTIYKLKDVLFFYRKHKGETMSSVLDRDDWHEMYKVAVNNHKQLFADNIEVFLDKIHIQKKEIKDKKQLNKMYKGRLEIVLVLFGAAVLYILSKFF